MTSSVYPYVHTEIRSCQITGLKPDTICAGQHDRYLQIRPLEASDQPLTHVHGGQMAESALKNRQVQSVTRGAQTRHSSAKPASPRRPPWPPNLAAPRNPPLT